MVGARTFGRAYLVVPLAVGAVAALLILFALARPLNHDESQYVAAVVLARALRPYRDFAYLQTPLQPLLLAPLAALFTGHALVALRLANAAFGLATLAFVYRAQRRAGVAPRIALAALALMACCDSFLFSAAVARNDMLPALFFSAGLAILAGGPGRFPSLASMLLGACFCVAAAAKISYGVPLAALVLLLSVDARSGRLRFKPVWVLVGMAAVALPLVPLFWSAPAAAWFEILVFPSRGPGQWYRAVGEGWRLGLGRLLESGFYLALGPALLGLVYVGRDRLRNGRPEDPTVRTIDWMLLAGIAAALLPAPAWRQYMMPILPPLFIQLGMTLSRMAADRRWLGLFALAALPGLFPTAVALVAALRSQTLPPVEAEREAHAAGAALRAAGVRGPVAGLSPHLWADSGLAIDPRFAAGPFVFRTHAMLDPADERRFHVVTQDDLLAEWRRDPPATIIVGGEGRMFDRVESLDATVARAALALGYRSLPLGTSRLRAYVPPCALSASQHLR